MSNPAAQSVSGQEIKTENNYQDNKQYYTYQQQEPQQQPEFEANTVIYTSLNNSQPQHFSSTQSLDTNRGLKRAHDETVVSDLDHKLYTNAGNNDQPQEVATNRIEVKVKPMAGLIHEQVVNEGDGDEDDDDDDASFNHEPVLSKILDEKKLALSYSPEVIKFFNSLHQNILPKH